MNFSRYGLVVQSSTTSFTGTALYSDVPPKATKDFVVPVLNRLAKIPLIGRVAGIMRIALAIIHVIGHLFLALITQNRAHLYHAVKGCCEAFRGLIEAIPIFGDIFANSYTGFWIVRMYNPERPDRVDTASYYTGYEDFSKKDWRDQEYWIRWKNHYPENIVICDPFRNVVNSTQSTNIKPANRR